MLSQRLCSCLAQPPDGSGEGASLFPDDGKLSRILGVLELGVGNVFALQSGDQHGLLQQCGIAKTRSAKNDTIRAILPHSIDQPPATLSIGRIARSGCHTLRQVSLRQVLDRVALLWYLAREPAQTQQQIVVHDPTASAFQGDEQRQRRLFTEHARQYDSAAILRQGRSLRGQFRSEE